MGLIVVVLDEVPEVVEGAELDAYLLCFRYLVGEG